MKNGLYNEFKFINKLNNKYIFQLDNKFINLLKKIYNSNIDKNDYVQCFKSFKTDKADIVISINNNKKYISIKSGKNNSVHLEPLFEFEKFLKENGISDEVIRIYKSYHYASDENGKRLSAKEYQEIKYDEIEKFNKSVNQEAILIKAINRFLFKGLHEYNHQVDGIIYGDIDNFNYYQKEEIINFLIQRANETFNSIHFSSLTVQPWTRNLNYNIKYEYRRDYVQVKWYRLEEMLPKIYEQ